MKTKNYAEATIEAIAATPSSFVTHVYTELRQFNLGLAAARLRREGGDPRNAHDVTRDLVCGALMTVLLPLVPPDMTVAQLLLIAADHVQWTTHRCEDPNCRAPDKNLEVDVAKLYGVVFPERAAAWVLSTALTGAGATEPAPSA